MPSKKTRAKKARLPKHETGSTNPQTERNHRGRNSRHEHCYRRGPRELFIIAGTNFSRYRGAKHGISGLLADQIHQNSPYDYDCEELHKRLGIDSTADRSDAIPSRTLYPCLFTCGDDFLQESGCSSWHPMLCVDCAVERRVASPDEAERIVVEATRDRREAEDLVRSGAATSVPAAYCLMLGMRVVV